MAGSYSLTGARVTILNAAQTLAWVNPIAASNKDLIFRRFWIGQTNNMAPINLACQLNTQVTAFPTVVSATPAKLSNVDGASVIVGGTGAAGTSGTLASAEGAGAKTIVWPDQFNTNNGWLLIPTDYEVIKIAAGSASGMGMYLATAPGANPATTLWTFGLIWQE